MKIKTTLNWILDFLIEKKNFEGTFSNQQCNLIKEILTRMLENGKFCFFDYSYLLNRLVFGWLTNETYYFKKAINFLNLTTYQKNSNMEFGIFLEYIL